MKAIIIAASALAALAPATAAAQTEDWAEIGNGVMIDRASVRQDGTIRRYTGRTAVKEDGRNSIYKATADCAAKTTNVIHLTIHQNGKPSSVHDYPDGGKTMQMVNPNLMQFVCGALPTPPGEDWWTISTNDQTTIWTDALSVRRDGQYMTVRNRMTSAKVGEAIIISQVDCKARKQRAIRSEVYTDGKLTDSVESGPDAKWFEGSGTVYLIACR